MNEKEFSTQLNKLKLIKPDRQWKKASRDILYSQIYNTSVSQEVKEAAEVKNTYLYYFINYLPKRIFKHASQPVWTVAAIIILVFSGGVASLKAANNSKPGDSLYIAKIISEKTQLALTFNEKDKAKLSIEFAGNRVEEINQVIAEPGDGKKKDKVDKLTINFKKEIDVAKKRLAKISASAPAKEDKSDATPADNQADEDSLVFGANLGKDDKGMQISDNSSNNNNEPTAVKTDDALSLEAVSTSTPVVAEEVSADNAGNLQDALKEAGQLIDDEDYGATLTKLDEANVIMDKVSGINESDGQTADSNANSGTASSSEAIEGEVK